jgi:hypothetical protein
LGLPFKGTAMRAIVKTLIGIAAAIACVAAALTLTPATASAQDIGGFVGGMMRGYGMPRPVYRSPPVHHSAPAASHKDSKDSDEEDSDSGKSAKNSDKNCSDKDSDKNSSDKKADKDSSDKKADKNCSDKNSADKNSSDKNSSDKSANADNKPRRQLSNAKDDTPGPTPAAKAEPAKATADEEPLFSPSR